MLSLDSNQFSQARIEHLLIPSEKVAHVQIGNNLNHALLVLIKTGYTAIPVLDMKFMLRGLISTNMILDSILGLERIEYEKLDVMKVEDVMNKEIPRLQLKDKLLKGLDLTVNHPFICVENEQGYFEGILTRRAILKQLNRHLRQLNKD
ncbi:CBS domain-containing protein [Bacillus sp. HMF5848]|uniref:cyclic-di-AMP-binding protein CbpB n=1 Tax=Bacillus sp. HMF5848 TaxID=2495421 RepID=UPI000F766B07|nr:cyclic-di-AMP-binding protein CbpB [Bacillus sp. HMF5848]RSK26850.1 CBS domain-containing protein [Bacillus sp. HMF5848]